MENKNSFPQRKSMRLKSFDYSSTGAYFLTLCIQDRKNILSTVVGEGSPLPKLTNYGEIVDKWILKIPEKYEDYSIDTYVVMPNHVHILLSVMKNGGRGDPSPTVSNVVGWLKYQVTKEINEIRGTAGTRVFQRTFWEHIVRNREDYYGIYKYILDNPKTWCYDKLYTEE